MMMRIKVIMIIAEYVRRVKKLCRSKLNGGNFISINAWAEGVVRHSADIGDWTVEELVSMDRKNRKITIANKWLSNTRRKVARLYLQSCTTIKTNQLQRIEKRRVT